VSHVGIDPAGRSPEELIDEGWKARNRDEPAVAHDLFVAAHTLAREHYNTAGEGRSLAALADNAFHFYPVENVDVFSIRESLAEHALDLLRQAGDENGIAAALRTRATIASRQHGRDLLDESLAICKRIGDTEGVISSLDSLGAHLALHGDNAEATTFKRKALELARVLDRQDLIAASLFSLAIGFDGDQDEHRALLEEAQSIYQRLGRKTAQAHCLILCAQLACDETDWERQFNYFEKAATAARASGDVSTLCTCLDSLIDVARSQGHTSKVEILQRERDSLQDPFEFPDEMMEDLEQAFSTGSAETAISAFRKWFTG